MNFIEFCYLLPLEQNCDNIGVTSRHIGKFGFNSNSIKTADKSFLITFFFDYLFFRVKLTKILKSRIRLNLKLFSYTLYIFTLNTLHHLCLFIS